MMFHRHRLIQSVNLKKTDCLIQKKMLWDNVRRVYRIDERSPGGPR